ncbi:hypothetical protein FGIG_04806 [Fasciola gigantica]|uniref:Uncharacterized protein n=1 Tax=Fasciola gigantica TaxID=46835 RepID=A0A504Z435_FASGI|nr:hypothetical protein FGIG_04806 [Fasciola gigantica]
MIGKNTEYLPGSELIRERTERNFPLRRNQLTVVFSNYLDHVNRVVNVHLDIPAEDKYNPFEWNENSRCRETTSAVSRNKPNIRVQSVGQPVRLLRRSETECASRVASCPAETERAHSTPFEQQLRPSPRPNAWRRVQFYYINSDVRLRSRNRYDGAFNRSDLPITAM